MEDVMGDAAPDDSGFTIMEAEVIEASVEPQPQPASDDGSTGGSTNPDGSASFGDLSALRASRLQADYFVEEGQPPSPVPSGSEPEPEPEPELLRDFLGYVVEDDSADSWQLSKKRKAAHEVYVADRNKAWAREASRDSAANLANIPPPELLRYRTLYREGFFAQPDAPASPSAALAPQSSAAFNPGHTQLLHDVSTGRRADLVRKGVPPGGAWSRGCVWQLYSGALSKQLQFPEMYVSLKKICEQQAETAQQQGLAVGDAVVVVAEPRNRSFLEPGQAGTVTATKGEGDALRIVVRASADDVVQSTYERECTEALAAERSPPPPPFIATGEYELADLKPASSEEAHRQVELDLHRTIPQHDGIQSTEIIGALRRVLLAYAYRNSAVGYCQSMNFIAAHMLLHVEETPAFWLLTTLVEDILPSSYFERGMIGVRVDVGVCEDMIAAVLPRLAEHLTSLDCYTFGLRGLLTQWIMTQFVTALPPETVGRVWDSLFYTEGDRTMFRVVVALFRRLEKRKFDSLVFFFLFLFLFLTTPLLANDVSIAISTGCPDCSSLKLLW
jgi:hypothetical protein